MTTVPLAGPPASGLLLPPLLDDDPAELPQAARVSAALIATPNSTPRFTGRYLVRITAFPSIRSHQ
jgi:hypothetical protein